MTLTALSKLRDSTTLPTEPVHGDIWIDSNSSKAYVYTNNSWSHISYDVDELSHSCDWAWEHNTIKIHNDKWWVNNKFEIFDWLLDCDIKWNWKSTDELQLKELSNELKTMFTLRWK
jgi:hypothetical protein